MLDHIYFIREYERILFFLKIFNLLHSRFKVFLFFQDLDDLLQVFGLVGTHQISACDHHETDNDNDEGFLTTLYLNLLKCYFNLV